MKAMVADILLEGNEVLRLLQRDNFHAEYMVHGFTEETILIHDYRKKGLAALDAVATSGNKGQFPYDFSGPAQVTIHEDWETQIVVIRLEDSTEWDAEDMLYIAVGLPDGIPIFPYAYGRVSHMDDDHYALVGIIQPEGPISDLTRPEDLFDAYTNGKSSSATVSPYPMK